MSFFLSLAVRPFACSGRAAYAHATQAERRWCKSSRGLFILSPLFLALPFAFLPGAKGGKYAPVAQWVERPDDAGEQRWFESGLGLGDPHFSR